LLGAVAHVYNPSYLGGRNWEDHSLRPVRAKLSKTPTSTNKLGGMWLSSQLHKKHG
jgi:hypothetical protein